MEARVPGRSGSAVFLWLLSLSWLRSCGVPVGSLWVWVWSGGGVLACRGVVVEAFSALLGVKGRGCEERVGSPAEQKLGDGAACPTALVRVLAGHRLDIVAAYTLSLVA